MEVVIIPETGYGDLRSIASDKKNYLKLEWTVEDFSSNFSDRNLESPNFEIPFNKSEWKLKLYYTDKNEEFYGIRANCRNCSHPIQAVCTFSILNQQNKKLVNTKENGFDWHHFDEGNFAIIPTYILKEDLKDLEHDGKLVIMFDVTIFRTNNNTDEILSKEVGLPDEIKFKSNLANICIKTE